MPSNALHEAKRLAHDVAITTTVRIDLATLQDLISELELIKQQFADFTELREKLNAAKADPRVEMASQFKPKTLP